MPLRKKETGKKREREGRRKKDLAWILLVHPFVEHGWPCPPLPALMVGVIGTVVLPIIAAAAASSILI